MGELLICRAARTLSIMWGCDPLFAGIAVAPSCLRAREPHGRCLPTLASIAPGIFVLACLAIVLNAFYRNPGPSSLGLLVIGAGIPLYMFLTRRRR